MYIGNKEVIKVYIGNKDVSSIYIGTLGAKLNPLPSEDYITFEGDTEPLTFEGDTENITFELIEN